jgi:hypothetical protein
LEGKRSRLARIRERGPSPVMMRRPICEACCWRFAQRSGRFRTIFKHFLSGSRFFSETSKNENLRGKTTAELRYPNASDVIGKPGGPFT